MSFSGLVCRNSGFCGHWSMNEYFPSNNLRSSFCKHVLISILKNVWAILCRSCLCSVYFLVLQRHFTLVFPSLFSDFLVQEDSLGLKQNAQDIFLHPTSLHTSLFQGTKLESDKLLVVNVCLSISVLCRTVKNTETSYFAFLFLQPGGNANPFIHLNWLEEIKLNL